MKEADALFWKNILMKPGGLVASVTEIDEFLTKHTLGSEQKLEIFIENIAVYFQKNKIIDSKPTKQDITDCRKLIVNEVALKHISTSADFILRILISLLSKIKPNNETNYLTTKNQPEIEDKIKKISQDFLIKNRIKGMDFIDQMKTSAQDGKIIITKETIANRKKLFNSYRGCFV